MTTKLQSDQRIDTLFRVQSNLRGTQRVLWNSLLERLERRLTASYHLSWPAFARLLASLSEQSHSPNFNHHNIIDRTTNFAREHIGAKTCRQKLFASVIGSPTLQYFTRP
jgi:hypothetical protein